MKNNIKAYIDRRELTIAAVIMQTGFSKSYFYDVMKGRTTPSLINARKIAAVLEVPLAELFPEEQVDEKG